MKARMTTVLAGSAFFLVAATTVSFMPLAAVASAVAGVACALLMKRSRGAGASDVADLCRIVVLSGCGSILGVEFFSARSVLEFDRARLAPVFEDLFFNFGGFALGYVVVCFVIFVVIMGSQTERGVQ